MPPIIRGPARTASVTQDILNGVLNLFWSALILGPACVFCAGHVPADQLYGFGALSLIPACLPGRVIDRMAISASPVTYRRLGVRFAERFTQDGAIVRGFGRRKRLAPPRLADAAMRGRLQRRTLLRERFHLVGLVFFLLLTGRAAWLGEPRWAAFLLAGNVIYNGYPILLQQYVRLRLRRLAGRSEPDGRN